MMQYNEEQLEAIRHENGPMLVMAGPGCGKTAVITGRVKHLIERGVSPSAILVATFTRAAADEMKERFLRFHTDSGLCRLGPSVLPSPGPRRTGRTNTV